MDLLPGSYGYSPTSDVFAQSFPFYCIDSGKFVNGDRYYTKRDNFDNYLLIVTDSGRGKLVWKNQSCILEKGSAVLIDCNSYHEYFTLPKHEWSFFYLHFKALSMEGYKSAFLSKLTPIKLKLPKSACQIVDQIYQMSFRADIISYATQSNMISNLLTEMLHSLVNDDAATLQIYRPDIAALTEYIRDNCTKSMGIEDFSKMVHLSKSHLIRVFERQTGMSPYKYLHMCRINKAAHLLRVSDMTVAQIAYAVGYDNPIVLTRHFKAFHQTTPREYRKVFVMLPREDSEVETDEM